MPVCARKREQSERSRATDAAAVAARDAYHAMDRDDPESIARYRAAAGRLLDLTDGYALKVARDIAERRHRAGLPPARADLIQAARWGILDAIPRYDGVRAFSTYATIWMRRRILLLSLENLSVIHVPRDVLQGIRRAAREGRDLDEFERDGALALAAVPISALSGDSSLRGGGIFEPAAREPDPPDEAQAARVDRLLQLMAWRLGPRQRDVVRRHLGLGDGLPLSFAAIARQDGVTRDRVRQIYEGAIGILRRAARADEAAFGGRYQGAP